MAVPLAVVKAAPCTAGWGLCGRMRPMWSMECWLAGAGFGHAAARLWDFRLYNLRCFPSTVSPAGEVVALYHFKEAERIEGPAVVGESVLLQVRAAQGQGLS